MSTDLYLERDTPIHGLDPRTKLAVFLLECVVMMLFEHPLWVLPVSLLILYQAWLAQIWINLRRIRTLMLVLAATGLVMWSLFAQGQTPLFGWLTVESLAYGVSRTLFILSTLVAGMVFVSTTRHEEFVAGLIRLGLPYRVGFAISTTIRLVPLVLGSITTITQAQQSRGVGVEQSSLGKRLQSYVALLAPVFISTLRSTNTFSMALETRGFGASARRTFYLQPQLRAADYLCLAGLSLLLILALWLRLNGYGLIDGLGRF